MTTTRALGRTLRASKVTLRRSRGDLRATGLLQFTPASVRFWSLRAGYVGMLATALILPTTHAAFNATTSNSGDSWTVSTWKYTAAVQALNPYLYWKLDETGTTSTAADSSGNGRTGSYNINGASTYFTRLSGSGALAMETPNNAVTLNNANSCINTTSTTAIKAPATVTVIAWFKAPSTYTIGGKILGFENPRTGVATPGSGGTYDRQLYLDGNGRILFGVYNGGFSILSSAAGFNNGAWHMAVGTVGAGGTGLYIDGSLVASNSNNAGETSTGFWRAGCGNLAGWSSGWTGPNAPSASSSTAVNYPFQGSLDELAVINSALTASQVSSLYSAH
jgi:hypothetical protein